MTYNKLKNWLLLLLTLITIVAISRNVVNGISINNQKSININDGVGGGGLNITYDGRSLLINGERRLLISGSIHYPRTSEKMWPVILKKSKDSGIDVIETYVFWNLHQPNSPDEFYLDGNANITLFLDLCSEIGLYVNLRIGPYVCAEWNYGGFPFWLKQIQGIVYRDYNDAWMNEMEKWVTLVVDKLQEYFAGNGGPIIMAQIENEYGWLEAEYGINGTLYAKWAIGFANSLSVGGVPWIMCAQDNIDTAINTCNGFYCHDWIAGHKYKYPDQPSFWTENWVGWFEDWSTAVPKRPVQDILFATVRFIAYGGSLVNYYMWFGGTNFGRTSGGPSIITSYDYDSPLDEFGMANEPKYSLLCQLHSILHEYQLVLLNNGPPSSPIALSNISEAHPYGNEFVFLTNFGTIIDYVSWQNVSYKLEPWSVQIVNNGSVLFDTSNLQQINSNGNTRNKLQVVPGVITEIVEFSEFNFLPSIFSTGGVISNSSPLEQLSITNDQSDYLWYFINITSLPTSSDGYTLSISEFYDYIHIFIDNIYKGSASSSTLNGFPLNLTGGQIQSQSFQLQILSMTIGLENYAVHMENYTRGLLGDIFINNVNITLGQWYMSSSLEGEKIKIYDPSSPSVNWATTNEESSSSPLTWYRLNVSLSGLSNDTLNTVYALNMTGMNKGMIYVNGYSIGRYWLINSTNSICNDNSDDYIGIYNPDNYRVGCGNPSQSVYSIPIDWFFNTTIDNSQLFATVILIEELGGNPFEIQLLSFTTTTSSSSATYNNKF